jgi:hypothetical protein
MTAKERVVKYLKILSKFSISEIEWLITNNDLHWRTEYKQAIQCAISELEAIIEALKEYDERNNTFELQNMDADFRYYENELISLKTMLG